MEENLLLDAIERYRNGEMTERRKFFLKSLGKTILILTKWLRNIHFF